MKEKLERLKVIGTRAGVAMAALSEAKGDTDE
ncbi:hypothetical protein PSP31121_05270 [Pandoraea sputorum]|uniref:Uncharacterized protein n=1 Tax=Pandoraea sputorum TaxID=93222 RepID=A0A5E5BKD0_9BURK|nr:hypothetical protein PSP31121_05270 [Pandoraea sputorum]